MSDIKAKLANHPVIVVLTALAAICAIVPFATGKKDWVELRREFDPRPSPEVPFPDRGPVESVMAYWSAVDVENFEAAWQSLSPGFKERSHSSDYDVYLRAREQMALCSVRAEDLRLDAATSANAVVQGALVFRTGGGCRSSREVFDFHLTKASRGRWLIDRVLPAVEHQ